MKNNSRRNFIKAFLIGCISVLGLDSLWAEHFFYEWNTFDLSEKTKRPIRLIQLSDLHLNKIKSQHRSIVKKINRLKPDVILLTGDAIDKAENIDVLDNFMRSISLEIKKIAILGNWEYWGKVNLPSLRQVYSKHNCTLLVNENMSLNYSDRKLTIVGVDDMVGGNPNFQKATLNLSTADKIILLAHCPEFRDMILKNFPKNKVDIILSGHTHGGQITLFGIPLFKPTGSGKYLKGWYGKNSHLMYVSRGIGSSIFPIRVGSRSEVVEILI